jgi:hypothetical protein
MALPVEDYRNFFSWPCRAAHRRVYFTLKHPIVSKWKRQLHIAQDGIG